MSSQDDMVRELMSKGRYGDTILAHINPHEAMELKAMGGSGTINPHTGLLEMFEPGPDSGAPGAAANGWGYDGPNGPTTTAGGTQMMPNYFGGGFGGGAPSVNSKGESMFDGLGALAGSLWSGFNSLPANAVNSVRNMFSPAQAQPTQLAGGMPTQLAGATDNYYGNQQVPTPPARPNFEAMGVPSSVSSFSPSFSPGDVYGGYPGQPPAQSAIAGMVGIDPYGAAPSFNPAPQAPMMTAAGVPQPNIPQTGPWQGPNLPANPMAAGTGYGNFSTPSSGAINPVSAGLMNRGPAGLGWGGNSGGFAGGPSGESANR